MSPKTPEPIYTANIMRRLPAVRPASQTLHGFPIGQRWMSCLGFLKIYYVITAIKLSKNDILMQNDIYFVIYFVDLCTYISLSQMFPTAFKPEKSFLDVTVFFTWSPASITSRKTSGDQRSYCSYNFKPFTVTWYSHAAFCKHWLSYHFPVYGLMLSM